MAKFAGNIFNKARGSIGGNTFSEARGRKGKIQTGRQRVAPTNPNTPAQQNARGKMAHAQFIVRQLGPSYYQVPFDRKISKLPGYQSLVSVLLRMSRVVGDDVVYDVPYPPITGDGLPGVSSVSFIFDDFVSLIDMSWNYSPSFPGDPDDRVRLIYIQGTAPLNAPTTRYVATTVGTPTRSSGNANTEEADPPLQSDGARIIRWVQSPAGANIQKTSVIHNDLFGDIS